MNTFDLVVTVVVLLLALLGFRAGLLRSVADILGYLVAAPIAIGGISICFLLILFLGFSSFIFRLGIQLSRRFDVVSYCLFIVYIIAF